MAAEAWMVRASTELWLLAGGPSSPRDLNRLLRCGLGMWPIAKTRLTLGFVADFVRKMGLPEVAAAPDRDLRGCLVVGLGKRLVFYDADDEVLEQRYTLAHEISHLWLEVIEPRERIRRRLGEGALEVLDGCRDPTPAERLQALLHRMPLNRPFHLLERDPDLGIRHEHIFAAEERADRLAVELLAPEEEALLHLPANTIPYGAWLDDAAIRLGREFQLPSRIARSYSQKLAGEVGVGPSFWDRLHGTRH